MLCHNCNSDSITRQLTHEYGSSVCVALECDYCGERWLKVYSCYEWYLMKEGVQPTMKVTINRIERPSLEDFADWHNLSLTVTEVGDDWFDARLNEVSKIFMLRGDCPKIEMKHGQTDTTAQKAVVKYAKSLSGHEIHLKDGRVITAPCLTVAGFYE